MAAPPAPPDLGTWVTYIGDRAAAVAIRRCRLVVTSGAGAGESLVFDAGPVRIGARSSCDLVLRDPKISGFHCEVRIDGGSYKVIDLGSTNGTAIDGVRIAKAFWEPGQTLTIGTSTIALERLGETTETPLHPHSTFGDLVGGSVAMRALYAKLAAIAPSQASVLITGETGVGKELVAKAIHDHSPRAAGPFVVVDCGAIPANLISSELFGHQKGAFTGATADYVGAFERANGGTVFLDEIGELPHALQPALLGVLERRQLRRVGGTRSIPLDLRVVSATHRNLVRHINDGLFREDLYYRLAVVQAHVPPLRERLEDVPALVANFLAQMPGDGARISDKAMQKLANHRYPGNVRELRNLIERATLFAGDDIGQVTSAGLPVPPPREGDAVDVGVAIDPQVPFKQAKRALVSEFERRYLRAQLRAHDGNVSAVARASGLDRMTVHKMLARCGLDRR